MVEILYYIILNLFTKNSITLDPTIFDFIFPFFFILINDPVYDKRSVCHLEVLVKKSSIIYLLLKGSYKNTLLFLFSRYYD